VFSPGELVTSEEGAGIRGKVWIEILDALAKIRPDIRSVTSFDSETR
jgi:hypothetical protein